MMSTISNLHHENPFTADPNNHDSLLDDVHNKDSVDDDLCSGDDK